MSPAAIAYAALFFAAAMMTLGVCFGFLMSIWRGLAHIKAHYWDATIYCSYCHELKQVARPASHRFPRRTRR
jgi:hypothetical protein